MKTCRVCKKTLQGSLFVRRGRSWGSCSSCSEQKRKYNCAHATDYKKWYAKNKVSHMANVNAYKKKNPEKVKYWHNKNWSRIAVMNSKVSDKKHCREWTDAEYVTAQFLLNQFDEQEGACYWCGTEMQTQNRRQDNGLTIERLNNRFPHTRENCRLACFKCNVKQWNVFKEPFLLC